MGDYERAETALVRQILERGDVCIDVGANIGYYTLIFAEAVGANGRVIAVEPQLDLAERIETMTRHLPQVVTYPVALSSGTGFAEIWVSRGHSHLATLKTSQYGRWPLEAQDRSERIAIRTARLDDLIREPRIGLLKVDVEGWEPEVFQGATGVLERTDAILFEVLDNWAAVSRGLAPVRESHDLYRVSLERRGRIGRWSPTLSRLSWQRGPAKGNHNVAALASSLLQKVSGFIDASTTGP
jgi:FkbM family methyltransferase